MSIPKRHHYVPRTYLKPFTDPPPYLPAIYDWEKNAYYKGKKSYKRFPTEDHMYSYLDHKGEINAKIEQFFAERVEKPYSRSLERIIQTRRLIPEDKIVLSRLIGSQLVRTPYHREYYKHNLSSLAYAYSQTDMLDMKAMFEEKYPLLTKDQWEKIINRLKQDFRNWKVPQEQYLESLLRLCKQITDHLYKQNWYFLIIKDSHQSKSFVTSDDPFNLVPPEGMTVRESGVVGAMKCISLTPKWCLVIEGDGFDHGFIEIENPKIIDQINEQIALRGGRYLIAKYRHSLERTVTRMKNKGLIPIRVKEMQIYRGDP